MSSREEENDDSEKPKQPRNHGKSTKVPKTNHLERKGEEKSASATSSGASDFSKLMEGIVFALSGFVNPERGVLRSKMLEMGAEYQPDWNSNCTLLVCAFANTPKFRQVKADGGTIISKWLAQAVVGIVIGNCNMLTLRAPGLDGQFSLNNLHILLERPVFLLSLSLLKTYCGLDVIKDWISECYNERKLVDIEPFLLHAGKPWRKQGISHEDGEDIKPSTSSKSLKQDEKGLHSKKTTGSSKMKGCFSPSKVKKWAVEDLKRTIAWLESQDEKDAIEALKQGLVWAFWLIIVFLHHYVLLENETVQFNPTKSSWHRTDSRAMGLPSRVVEELAQFDRNRDDTALPSKEDLCREAMACKQIYELEFLNMEHEDIVASKKRPETHGSKKVNKKENVAKDDPCYDSDATIEMTEDEINQAYNTVARSL
ncbi:hypothetical protein DH2020_041363 [Rehmannia glutinosa]|uniref:BRCT domain-containing protein n=1 Tax=Rehmannia glutinosa TaxID=99300 RepID=A0ABR0URT6_REHGL